MLITRPDDYTSGAVWITEILEHSPELIVVLQPELAELDSIWKDGAYIGIDGIDFCLVFRRSEYEWQARVLPGLDDALDLRVRAIVLRMAEDGARAYRVTMVSG
jgi:hypothetical protein